MSEYCKQRVYRPGGSFTGGQCRHKVWKDGYCKIHHPDSVRARQQKRDEQLKQKVADNSPLAPLKKEVARTKELGAQIESLKLKWTKELPSKVGWYWRRDKLFDDGLSCVEIHNYAGKLWQQGNRLDDNDVFWSRYEWAGPIPVPEG